MPETTIQVAQNAWDVIKWVLAFALGLIGFNVRRTMVKVDDHDKNHITRDEFNDTVKTMRKENREDFKGIHQKMDELLKK